MNALTVATAQTDTAIYTPEEVRNTSKYLKAQNAPNTDRAYASGVKQFEVWCADKGATALPALPATVAMYLSALAAGGASLSTVTQRAAAINHNHQHHGHESPTRHPGVKAVLSGIRRTVGAAPKGRKTPATTLRLVELLRNVPTDTAGLRDRALLLLGFTGAFRRSELVALTVADIEEVPEGLRVTIRKSKTDQGGVGRMVPVGRGSVHCPVQAVNAWLEAADIEDGPLFRPTTRTGKVGAGALTDQMVARIVKKYAAMAGLDASAFAGHSLRSGFLTAAAENGADVASLARVSGHKSVEMLVNTYIRPANLFERYAGQGLL